MFRKNKNKNLPKDILFNEYLEKKQKARETLNKILSVKKQYSNNKIILKEKLTYKQQLNKLRAFLE